MGIFNTNRCILYVNVLYMNKWELLGLWGIHALDWPCPNFFCVMARSPGGSSGLRSGNPQPINQGWEMSTPWFGSMANLDNPVAVIVLDR